MVVKNLGWIVAAGLAAVLAWSACSCSRDSDLTDEQKRGLEVLARVANPDPLQERWAKAHNGLCLRAIDDANLEEKCIKLYLAQESLDAEYERRFADKFSEEAVSWYETETSRTDAEIVARWKPAATDPKQ